MCVCACVCVYERRDEDGRRQSFQPTGMNASVENQDCFGVYSGTASHQQRLEPELLVPLNLMNLQGKRKRINNEDGTLSIQKTII